MSEVSWSNTSYGAWCYYNNDASNNDIYGKLYNFHALVGDTIAVEKYVTNNDNIVVDTLFYDSFHVEYVLKDGKYHMRTIGLI